MASDSLPTSQGYTRTSSKRRIAFYALALVASGALAACSQERSHRAPSGATLSLHLVPDDPTTCETCRSLIVPSLTGDTRSFVVEVEPVLMLSAEDFERAAVVETPNAGSADRIAWTAVLIARAEASQRLAALADPGSSSTGLVVAVVDEKPLAAVPRTSLRGVVGITFRERATAMQFLESLTVPAERIDFITDQELAAGDAAYREAVEESRRLLEESKALERRTRELLDE